MGEMSRPPVFTAEQRRANLEKAAEVRAARAELKRRMKSGEVGLEEAMADPLAQRMRVREFALALPGIGLAKADEFMMRAAIAPGKRMGGLGARQREALLALASGGAE